jgi:hypothetical protein
MDLKLNRVNESLLADLRNDFEIEFEKRNISYCEVFSRNGKSTIYYNPNLVENESIAHELLHIKLDRYTYVIGNHIYLSCQHHPKLGKVFSKFLCDYIENCFDHCKMYEAYLDMGYSAEKFLLNGLDEKCSIKDIKSLNLFRWGRYKANSINRYNGYLISIYADHVDNDYQKHLKLLKEKDSELFGIVTSFWGNLQAFDITNIDPVYNSEIDLSESFIFDMEKWSESKKIK